MDWATDSEWDDELDSLIAEQAATAAGAPVVDTEPSTTGTPNPTLPPSVPGSQATHGSTPVSTPAQSSGSAAAAPSSTINFSTLPPVSSTPRPTSSSHRRSGSLLMTAITNQSRSGRPTAGSDTGSGRSSPAPARSGSNPPPSNTSAAANPVAMEQWPSTILGSESSFLDSTGDTADPNNMVFDDDGQGFDDVLAELMAETQDAPDETLQPATAPQALSDAQCSTEHAAVQPAGASGLTLTATGAGGPLEEDAFDISTSPTGYKPPSWLSMGPDDATDELSERENSATASAGPPEAATSRRTTTTTVLAEDDVATAGTVFAASFPAGIDPSPGVPSAHFPSFADSATSTASLPTVTPSLPTSVPQPPPADIPPVTPATAANPPAPVAGSTGLAVPPPATSQPTAPAMQQVLQGVASPSAWPANDQAQVPEQPPDAGSAAASGSHTLVALAAELPTPAVALPTPAAESPAPAEGIRTGGDLAALFGGGGDGTGGDDFFSGSGWDTQPMAGTAVQPGPGDQAPAQVAAAPWEAEPPQPAPAPWQQADTQQEPWQQAGTQQTDMQQVPWDQPSMHAGQQQWPPQPGASTSTGAPPSWPDVNAVDSSTPAPWSQTQTQTQTWTERTWSSNFPWGGQQGSGVDDGAAFFGETQSFPTAQPTTQATQADAAAFTTQQPVAHGQSPVQQQPWLPQQPQQGGWPPAATAAGDDVSFFEQPSPAGTGAAQPAGSLQHSAPAAQQPPAASESVFSQPTTPFGVPSAGDDMAFFETDAATSGWSSKAAFGSSIGVPSEPPSTSQPGPAAASSSQPAPGTAAASQPGPAAPASTTAGTASSPELSLANSPPPVLDFPPPQTAQSSVTFPSISSHQAPPEYVRMHTMPSGRWEDYPAIFASPTPSITATAPPAAATAAAGAPPAGGATSTAAPQSATAAGAQQGLQQEGSASAQPAASTAAAAGGAPQGQAAGADPTSAWQVLAQSWPQGEQPATFGGWGRQASTDPDAFFETLDTSAPGPSSQAVPWTQDAANQPPGSTQECATAATQGAPASFQAGGSWTPPPAADSSNAPTTTGSADPAPSTTGPAPQHEGVTEAPGIAQSASWEAQSAATQSGREAQAAFGSEVPVSSQQGEGVEGATPATAAQVPPEELTEAARNWATAAAWEALQTYNLGPEHLEFYYSGYYKQYMGWYGQAQPAQETEATEQVLAEAQPEVASQPQQGTLEHRGAGVGEAQQVGATAPDPGQPTATRTEQLAVPGDTAAAAQGVAVAPAAGGRPQPLTVPDAAAEQADTGVAEQVLQQQHGAAQQQWGAASQQNYWAGYDSQQQWPAQPAAGGPAASNTKQPAASITTDPTHQHPGVGGGYGDAAAYTNQGYQQWGAQDGATDTAAAASHTGPTQTGVVPHPGASYGYTDAAGYTNQGYQWGAEASQGYAAYGAYAQQQQQQQQWGAQSQQTAWGTYDQQQQQQQQWGAQSQQTAWGTYDQQQQQQQQQQHWGGYGVATSPTGFANGWGAGYGAGAAGQSQPQLYLPGAGSASQMTFGGATANLYSAQYEMANKVVAKGTLVELPVSHTAARSCPNGRPAVPFLTFAFGGRTVVVHAPAPSTPGAAAGSKTKDAAASTAGFAPGFATDAPDSQPPTAITWSPLHELVDVLKKLNLAAPAQLLLAGRQSLGGISPTTPKVAVQHVPVAESLAGTRQLLSSFPGPLAPSVNRDKLVKYLQERALAYPQEDPHASQGPVELGTLMWQVLAVQVRQGVVLKGMQPVRPQARDSHPFESDLVKLLGDCGEAGAGASQGAGPISTASGTAAPHKPTGAGGLLQTLGLGTRGSGHTAETPRWSSGHLPMTGAHAPLPLVCGDQDTTHRSNAALEVQRLLTLGKRAEAVKVASGAGLWGVALLLASTCPPPLFLEVATAMSQAQFLPGSPLHTAALVVSGRPDLAVPLTPSEAGGAGATGAGGAAQAAGSVSAASGAPHLAPGLQGGQGTLLCSWRLNLAALAATARTPADLEAILRLGDRLGGEGADPRAAQVCYLVAGALPGFWSPAEDLLPLDPTHPGQPARSPRAGTTAHARRGAGAAAAGPPTGAYCLLGTDHHSAPRTFVNLLAVQRTEVFEFALQSGTTGLPGDTGAGCAVAGTLAALLPYKLAYAYMLSEAGLMPEALAYCGVLEAALKDPRGPAVQAALPASYCHLLGKAVDELRERLTTFASHHAINLSKAESSITRIGKFLDNTLTRLLWGGGGAAEGGAQGNKRSGSATPADADSSGVASRSASVFYGGPQVPVSPLLGGTPGGTAPVPDAPMSHPGAATRGMSRAPSSGAVSSVSMSHPARGGPAHGVHGHPLGGMQQVPSGVSLDGMLSTGNHSRTFSHDDFGRPPLPYHPHHHHLLNSGPPSTSNTPPPMPYSASTNTFHTPTPSAPHSAAHSRTPSGLPAGIDNAAAWGAHEPMTDTHGPPLATRTSDTSSRPGTSRLSHAATAHDYFASGNATPTHQQLQQPPTAASNRISHEGPHPRMHAAAHTLHGDMGYPGAQQGGPGGAVGPPLPPLPPAHTHMAAHTPHGAPGPGWQAGSPRRESSSGASPRAEARHPPTGTAATGSQARASPFQAMTEGMDVAGGQQQAQAAGGIPPTSGMSAGQNEPTPPLGPGNPANTSTAPPATPPTGPPPSTAAPPAATGGPPTGAPLPSAGGPPAAAGGPPPPPVAAGFTGARGTTARAGLGRYVNTMSASTTPAAGAPGGTPATGGAATLLPPPPGGNTGPTLPPPNMQAWAGTGSAASSSTSRPVWAAGGAGKGQDERQAQYVGASQQEPAKPKLPALWAPRPAQPGAASGGPAPTAAAPGANGPSTGLQSILPKRLSGTSSPAVGRAGTPATSSPAGQDSSGFFATYDMVMGPGSQDSVGPSQAYQGAGAGAGAGRQGGAFHTGGVGHRQGGPQGAGGALGPMGSGWGDADASGGAGHLGGQWGSAVAGVGVAGVHPQGGWGDEDGDGLTDVAL